MILLKKSLDELLKKNNIPSLYIERLRFSGGVLNLCTPCGKPLMVIPDVRIPHSKLTKDERDYLIEELTKIIMEKKDQIVEALDLHMNPIEQKEYAGYDVNTATSWRSKIGRYVKTGVSVSVANMSDGSFTIRIDDDGEITYEMSKIKDKDIEKMWSRITEMKKIGKEVSKTANLIVEQETKMADLLACKN